MLEERGINVTHVGITHAIFCHFDKHRNKFYIIHYCINAKLLYSYPIFTILITLKVEDHT